MNSSNSQARMAPFSGFATLDFGDTTPLDYLSGGGGGIQTFGTIEQSESQASPPQEIDIDANINGQSADESELLSDVQLKEVAVIGKQIPWLRRASLYKSVNYKGPTWLTGQENWVYLVALALAAGAAWWYFKRK